MIDHDAIVRIVTESGVSLDDIALFGRLARAQAAFQAASVIQQGYINVTFRCGLRWGELTFRRRASGGPEGEIEFRTLAEAVEQAERLVAQLQRGELQ